MHWLHLHCFRVRYINILIALSFAGAVVARPSPIKEETFDYFNSFFIIFGIVAVGLYNIAVSWNVGAHCLYILSV